MRSPASSVVEGVLAVTLLVTPLAAEPVLPIAAMLGKDVLRNIILGELKSQLLGTLSGMGCRGAALSGVLTTASAVRPAPGGMPQMPPGAGRLPGGMPLPAGTPTPGSAAVVPGVMPDAALMAQMMAMMQAQGASTGRSMSPEQMAQMADMQKAMAQPLSRAETIAVFNQLAELGILTPEMASEARDCILLAPPAAGDTIGMLGAMLKSMLLPRLIEAKAKLANLTPEEQRDLADTMVEELRNAPIADRSVFLDGGYGRGFYPATIVDRIKSRF